MEDFNYKVETDDERNELKDKVDERKKSSKDIMDFFDGFIKENALMRTRTFGEHFIVTVHPCSLDELLEAELMIRGTNPGIPMDTMVKLRACAILSFAIVKLGDIEIKKPNLSDDENIIRRVNLYHQLLSLPPSLITDMYAFYIEVVDEEKNIIKNPEKLKENIQDF